ncbi:MAG: hypothetical protein VXW32_10100 [Myxococcota bacterium]|nr:hypothetical protein [Myxococcota bacterium]
MTGPVWWTPNAFVGDISALDLQGSIWAYWWSAFSLEQGLNPFEGTHNYFPVGQEPVSQFNILDGLLSAPLVWVFGLRTGFNLACVVILATAGWGMRQLSLFLGLSSFSATASGVALMGSSYILQEMGSGRPTQALVVFFLLGLVGVGRIVTNQGAGKTVLGLGLCVAALGLVYWYYLPLFALAALLVCLNHRESVGLAALRRGMVSLALAAAVLMPFVLVLTQQYEELPGVERAAATDHVLFDRARGDFGMQMAIEDSEWPIWPLVSTPKAESRTLSWTVLALAVWGIAGRFRRERNLLVAVFVLGWLMSLGPYLKLGSEVPTSIPLPFLWMHDHLPFMDRFWWPHRWELLCAIGASGLAGLGVQRLVQSGAIRAWPQQLAVVGLLVLGSVATRGGGLSMSELPRSSSELYAGVDGPILSVPIGGDSLTGGLVLLTQTVHQRPITGGLGQHLPGHRPAEMDAWMQESSLMQLLLSLEGGDSATVTVSPEDVEALVDRGLRYAVLDPYNFDSVMSSRWVASYAAVYWTLFGEPVRIHEGGAVWRIRAMDEPVDVHYGFATRPDRRLR